MQQFEDTDWIQSEVVSRILLAEISLSEHSASALNALTEQALLLCGHMSCLLVLRYHQVHFIHFCISSRYVNLQ